jgi:redox-sensitive bicupin YhaK (pirin superfamily)
MPKVRDIRKVIKSRPTLEGAGVRLRRAVGFGDPALTDPFLLLDDFRSDTPEHYRKGFPWHPHRGIETITYVLRGEVDHGDSLGNSGTIGAGDVQWMTAGSGIIHQEMPRGDARGSMHGFQLWANLPAASKMMAPRYRGLAADDIPEARAGAAAIKVIAGKVGKVDGPVRDVVTSPQYLDVSLPSGASFSHPVPAGHTALAYVIGGEGEFSPRTGRFGDGAEGAGPAGAVRPPFIGDGHLVLFADGGEVAVSAGEKGVRFLLVSGKPIGEPVAWRGPIVMNTQEELDTAWRELEEGTFIKAGRQAG